MKRDPRREERFRYAVILYEAGESLTAVARLLGTKPETLGKSFRADGSRIRNRGEQAALSRRHHSLNPAQRLSREELEALYWGEELPSLQALAERLGVCWETLKTALVEKGMAVRSSSEQLGADARLGRRPYYGPGPTGPCADPPGVGRRSRAGVPYPKSPEVRAKIAAALTKRETRPCAWCGTPITGVPSSFQGGNGLAFCNSTCSNLFRYHEGESGGPPGSALRREGTAR